MRRHFLQLLNAVGIELRSERRWRPVQSVGTSLLALPRRSSTGCPPRRATGADSKINWEHARALLRRPSAMTSVSGQLPADPQEPHHQPSRAQVQRALRRGQRGWVVLRRCTHALMEAQGAPFGMEAWHMRPATGAPSSQGLRAFRKNQLDRGLLALVQANARETAANLGRKLEVARTTVITRIARLEADGAIIGYTSATGQCSRRNGVGSS